MASCRRCETCPYLEGVRNAERFYFGTKTEYHTTMYQAIEANKAGCPQAPSIREKAEVIQPDDLFSHRPIPRG